MGAHWHLASAEVETLSAVLTGRMPAAPIRRSWRVVAAAAPGVAATYPPQPPPTAADCAVFTHRLDEVLAACRFEPAEGAEKRTDPPLVAAYGCNHEIAGRRDEMFPKAAHAAVLAKLAGKTLGE